MFFFYKVRKSFFPSDSGVIAMESLHKQVLPFMLRRMKEDVLQDLPPKIIQDYYCTLSALQVRSTVVEFKIFARLPRLQMSSLVLLGSFRVATASCWVIFCLYVGVQLPANCHLWLLPILITTLHILSKMLGV